MRAILALLVYLLAACEEHQALPGPSPRPSFTNDPLSGELRARIATGRGAAAEMRSGPAVPVTLPRGFTIYPGSRVIRNTVVDRGGAQRILVEFETADPIAKVMLFHRAQAQAAGASLGLDLDGTDAASIGGLTADGGELALTARRDGTRTLVELFVSVPVTPTRR